MSGNSAAVNAELTADEAAAVLDLVERVTRADDTKPVSEHVLLRVRHGSKSSDRHVLLRDAEGDLVGYGYLEHGDDGSVAELAALDRASTEALVAAVAEAAGGGLRIWARGDGSRISAVLAELGYHEDRVLLQLRRSLADPLPEPVWPQGVTVRTFVTGRDEAAWLEVNNTAFASHPDQSGWTMADVTEREQEAWFDPAGFFLAERDAELVGFHWTKVHATDSAGGGGPVGEVYVVGVSPLMQGQRLGSALTLVGIRHLQASGLSHVMLYVDESNTSAVHVYERLGFARFDADRCFVRP